MDRYQPIKKSVKIQVIFRVLQIQMASVFIYLIDNMLFIYNSTTAPTNCMLTF